MKAIPITTCQSEKQEVCLTPECQLVILSTVCEEKEKTQVALLPEVINICLSSYFSYISTIKFHKRKLSVSYVPLFHFTTKLWLESTTHKIGKN